jgi:hypothetical protein
LSSSIKEGYKAKITLIKNYIQELSLKKTYRTKRREVLMLNFNAIKTIGLLSNPKTEAEIREIDKVIKHFKALNKQVFPLIYFDKHIENDIFTKNIDWSGFGKENCNWFEKPKKDININRFANKELDILIDLSFSKNFSLQYIFVQSKARLKIMPTSDLSKRFADLMIEASNSQSKLDFTKELIHHLEIINKDQQ